VFWAFAAALAGGLIVLLSSLIAGGVAGGIWIFNRSIAVTGAMGDTLRIAAWVFAPIGIAVSVWVAAYGATRQGSLPRALLAASAAIAVAVALLFLESSGLVAAGLAIGWALAIPATSPTRIAVRAVPLLVVALFLPRLGDLPVGMVVVTLVLSPPAAALGVFLADLPWSLRESGRHDD
jgi:hypothetical protein